MKNISFLTTIKRFFLRYWWLLALVAIGSYIAGFAVGELAKSI